MTTIDKKTGYGTVGLLVVLIALASYYHYSSVDELEAKLTAQKQELVEQNLLVSEYETLLQADSLFNIGKYTPAIKGYQQLLQKDSLVMKSSALNARIDHARWLISMRSVMDSLRADALVDDIQPIALP